MCNCVSCSGCGRSYSPPAALASFWPISMCRVMLPSKCVALAKNRGASRRTTTTPGVVLASGYFSTLLPGQNTQPHNITPRDLRSTDDHTYDDVVPQWLPLRHAMGADAVISTEPAGTKLSVRCELLLCSKLVQQTGPDQYAELQGANPSQPLRNYAWNLNARLLCVATAVSRRG